MIEVGVALAGHGGYDAPDDKKAYSIVVDFITPETDTSIWYFWGMARKFNVKDAALTAAIREGQGKIFSEDSGNAGTPASQPVALARPAHAQLEY